MSQHHDVAAKTTTNANLGWIRPDNKIIISYYSALVNSTSSTMSTYKNDILRKDMGIGTEKGNKDQAEAEEAVSLVFKKKKREKKELGKGVWQEFANAWRDDINLIFIIPGCRTQNKCLVRGKQILAECWEKLSSNSSLTVNK